MMISFGNADEAKTSESRAGSLAFSSEADAGSREENAILLALLERSGHRMHDLML
jgi:hypothetical protein